jgi:hypothetical protein
MWTLLLSLVFGRFGGATDKSAAGSATDSAKSDRFELVWDLRKIIENSKNFSTHGHIH